MEVLEAYVEKAMQIQKEINCCTQVIREVEYFRYLWFVCKEAIAGIRLC